MKERPSDTGSDEADSEGQERDGDDPRGGGEVAEVCLIIVVCGVQDAAAFRL